ncbi:MAG TPA: FAD-binding protein [Desulfobacteraceae bacterium]|nr:FAD-binding protein [Desulfobacteraceae bacterium]
MCAVWVKETDQVSRILRLANSHKLPVYPRGAGTGLSGMAVPSEGGIVMDLSKMNRLLELNIEDRVVVVQPGIIYDNLQKALSPHGFFFPPDPASEKVCTIGGNVSTNAGGIKGAKYGTTKDYVLALQVVLPDGRVMRTGTRAMKSASGYDLTRLFVGSEGTLGVITEITLKIDPKPISHRTVQAVFKRLEQAGRAVSEIMRKGIVPSVLEILDIHTIRCINQMTDIGLPEAEAILLAETDGFTSEEAEFQMDNIIETFRENGAERLIKAETEAQEEEIWKARKSAYGVLARIKSNFVLEDVTVPISRVPELLKGISEISKRNEIQIATFGHAGDGNLHPQILYDGYNMKEVEKMKNASRELFELAISLGGTLTGEHGIGLSKAPFMGLEHDEVEMDMMRKIKRLFDPNNILNPGKMAL